MSASEIEVQYPTMMDMNMRRRSSQSSQSSCRYHHNNDNNNNNNNNSDMIRKENISAVMMDVLHIQLLAQCDYIYDIITYMAIIFIPLLCFIFSVNGLSFANLFSFLLIQFSIQCLIDSLPLAFILYINPITISRLQSFDNFYQLTTGSSISVSESALFDNGAHGETREQTNVEIDSDNQSRNYLSHAYSAVHQKIKLQSFDYGMNLKIRYINIMNGWTSTKKAIKHYMWWTAMIVICYFAFYVFYPQRFLCATNQTESGDFLPGYFNVQQWQYVRCL
jgi:hypothetical protein